MKGFDVLRTVSRETVGGGIGWAVVVEDVRATGLGSWGERNVCKTRRDG